MAEGSWRIRRPGRRRNTDPSLHSWTWAPRASPRATAPCPGSRTRPLRSARDRAHDRQRHWPLGTPGGTAQQFMVIMPMKDVVAQHQRTGRIAHKLLANDERLRQAVRAGLHGVMQVDAPLAAVAQQLLKTRRILG